MGRPRKTTGMRLVEGTRDRRPLALVQNEPLPEGYLTDQPDWLSPAQRESWEYAIEHAPRGLLRKLDRGLLVGWVVAECLHRDASIKLENGPMLVKTPNGMVVPSPLIGIMNRQAVIMKSLGAELGFSPASRTSIALAPEDVPDPADRYFGAE